MSPNVFGCKLLLPSQWQCACAFSEFLLSYSEPGRTEYEKIVCTIFWLTLCRFAKMMKQKVVERQDWVCQFYGSKLNEKRERERMRKGEVRQVNKCSSWPVISTNSKLRDRNNTKADQTKNHFKMWRMQTHTILVKWNEQTKWVRNFYLFICWILWPVLTSCHRFTHSLHPALTRFLSRCRSRSRRRFVLSVLCRLLRVSMLPEIMDKQERQKYMLNDDKVRCVWLLNHVYKFRITEIGSIFQPFFPFRKMCCRFFFHLVFSAHSRYVVWMIGCYRRRRSLFRCTYRMNISYLEL